MKKYILSIITLLLILIGCSTDDSGIEDIDGNNPDSDLIGNVFNRENMLINWADNIILPGYNSFLSTLKVLNNSFENLKSEGTAAALQDFKEKWLLSYKEWQHVSMFEIGPAEEIGYRLQMNTYPADRELIESNIISASYNFELPSTRDAKGFAALDYILNGINSNDTDLLNTLTQNQDSSKYIQYIEDIIADMSSQTNYVIDTWNGSYRDSFIANSGSSASASVDKFVNDFIYYYEKHLRAGKMGIPLGVFLGSPAPQTIEVYYSPEQSKIMFLEGLNAVQDFFNGVHYNSNQSGESLASYLTALESIKGSQNLADLINEKFDIAREAVDALGSFKSEIELNNPPTNMLMAYDKVQSIVPLFKVDMISAMSINIDYVDADGD